MKHFRLMVFAAAVISGADKLAAQDKVEATGVRSIIKFEEVIFGHLTELNAKFKLRATEVTFAPQAELGLHHHVGPGIRYVLSGKLTFTEGGISSIYEAGDYFYEAGNIAHTVQNNTESPLRIIFFEVVPTTWERSTVIPPKSY
jgi:quercetin dioxygenase-like cupin family protein